MLRVSALGEISIEAENLRLTPAAPLNFALALVLVLERPGLISRDRLESVLFSDSTAKSASHCLRQTVYKLRRAGFPLESVPDGIRLTSEVLDDYSAYLGDPPSLTLPISRVSGGFLPNYSPEIATGFAEWLDEQRSRVNLGLRRFLLRSATAAKASGDLTRMEHCARACLTIDPLNEEATLSLAECLVLAGSKAEALMLLEEYEAGIGPAESLRIAPSLLRRRVSALPTAAESLPERRTIGRSNEIARILHASKDALDGAGTSLTFVGCRGIGKTRLLEETGVALRLQSFLTASHTCQRLRVRPPLGDVLSLLAKIRDLPGGLGAAPEALNTLSAAMRGANGDLDISIDAVCRAAMELLSAVCAERALALLIDDAHLADPLSRRVIERLREEARDLRFLAIATECSSRSASSGEILVELSPLSTSDSETVIRAVLSSTTADHVVAFLVQNSHGLPGTAISLSEHYNRTGRLAAPRELAHVWRDEIEALTSEPKLVLEGIALFGNQGTLERVQAVTGVPRPSFLNALRTLEERRLITTSAAAVAPLNDLLGDVVIDRMPESIRAYLQRRAGELLLAEGRRSGDLKVLWAAIDHFRNSGTLSAASAAITTCAEYALKVGRPTEARDLLTEALGTCMSARDRAAVAERLAEACYAATDWSGALAAIDLLPKASQCERINRIARDSQRHLGRSSAVAVPARDLSCLTELEQLDHLTSEFLHAEQRLDDTAAHDCYAKAQPLIERYSETAAASRLVVFFNTFFGDRTTARRRALECIQLVDAPDERKRPLFNWCTLGLALSLLDEPDAALGLYEHLLQKAARLRSSELRLWILTLRVDLLLDHARVKEAQETHKECSRIVQELGPSNMPMNYMGNAASLAIARGATTDARNALYELRKRWPLANEGRFAITMAAYEASIALHSGEECCDRTIESLEAGLQRLRPRKLYDEAMEGLLQGYSSLGKHEAVEIAANQYFSGMRDPNAPVLPRTRNVLQMLGVSLPVTQ